MGGLFVFINDPVPLNRQMATMRPGEATGSTPAVDRRFAVYECDGLHSQQGVRDQQAKHQEDFCRTSAEPTLEGPCVRGNGR